MITRASGHSLNVKEIFDCKLEPSENTICLSRNVYALTCYEGPNISHGDAIP